MNKTEPKENISHDFSIMQTDGPDMLMNEWYL